MSLWTPKLLHCALVGHRVRVHRDHQGQRVGEVQHVAGHQGGAEQQHQQGGHCKYCVSYVVTRYCYRGPVLMMCAAQLWPVNKGCGDAPLPLAGTLTWSQLLVFSPYVNILGHEIDVGLSSIAFVLLPMSSTAYYGILHVF